MKLDDGQIWHRHVNHLLTSQVQIESESIDQEYAPSTVLQSKKANFQFWKILAVVVDTHTKCVDKEISQHLLCFSWII